MHIIQTYSFSELDEEAQKKALREKKSSSYQEIEYDFNLEAFVGVGAVNEQFFADGQLANPELFIQTPIAQQMEIFLSLPADRQAELGLLIELEAKLMRKM